MWHCCSRSVWVKLGWVYETTSRPAADWCFTKGTPLFYFSAWVSTFSKIKTINYRRVDLIWINASAEMKSFSPSNWSMWDILSRSESRGSSSPVGSWLTVNMDPHRRVVACLVDIGPELWSVHTHLCAEGFSRDVTSRRGEGKRNSIAMETHLPHFLSDLWSVLHLRKHEGCSTDMQLCTEEETRVTFQCFCGWHWVYLEWRSFPINSFHCLFKVQMWMSPIYRLMTRSLRDHQQLLVRTFSFCPSRKFQENVWTSVFTSESSWC